MTKQRTWMVNGKKITIVSSPKSCASNPAGWIININGITFQRFGLNREIAEDSAYVEWVRNYYYS